MQTQTTMRCHFSDMRMAVVNITGDNQCPRGGGEKEILVHTGRECRLAPPIWKTGRRLLEQWNTELPHDPLILLLGIYLKAGKSLTPKGICTPIFTAALFTRTKTWKQLLCPSRDEWVKKIWQISERSRGKTNTI